MKRLLFLLLFSLPGLLIASAHAQSMGQPGYYGRIDIGNGYPQPTADFPKCAHGQSRCV